MSHKEQNYTMCLSFLGWINIVGREKMFFTFLNERKKWGYGNPFNGT